MLLESADTFATENTELRDRIAHRTLEIESADCGGAKWVDIALKAFELSQSLAERWVTADYPAKRHIPEIVRETVKSDNGRRT
jgi:hypothetical protein